jgi:hypothetical protein
MDASSPTAQDGHVTAIYPGDSDGDPDAVPAVYPETGEPDVASFELNVDGELFDLRPDKHGGTHYTWISGPNPGYGFSQSPTPSISMDEHRENIRNFLLQIDPSTCYIEDD